MCITSRPIIITGVLAQDTVETNGRFVQKLKSTSVSLEFAGTAVKCARNIRAFSWKKRLKHEMAVQNIWDSTLLL